MKCENHYEIEWWKAGKKKIIGIDEAGRGPMAGPLVVAAVAFPPGFSHEEMSIIFLSLSPKSLMN